MQNSLKTRTAFAFLLVIAVFVVFAPGLKGAFLFDDYPNIVTNPLVQPEDLSFDALARAARGYQAGHIGRPLATIGFALDYTISGKNPIAFKTHNLLLHSLNAWLVFLLASRLLALPRARWPDARWAAAAIALVWAIHPLQVSTVLYVVQRMEMLWATFVTLALLAYLRGRRLQMEGKRGWPWLAGSVGIALLGLLGKESAVLFPVFALSIELTLLRFDAADVRAKKALKASYAMGTAAAVIAFLVLLPGYLAPDAYGFRDFTVGERLLTQLRVLPMYLGQIVLPLPKSMGFYYDSLEISRSLFSPVTTLYGALVVIMLLAFAVVGRTRWPLPSLGLLWFFGSHLLTSNVFPLEIAYEHRNYFALFGIVLVGAHLLRLVTHAQDATARKLLFGVIALFLAFLCFLRSSTWGSELHLATSLVSINPDSPRASNDLATLYVGLSDGDPDSPFFGLGMVEFERGSRLPGASALPEQGLILSAASTGQPVADAWWDSLLYKTRTRPLAPQDSMAIVGLVRQANAGVAMDDERLAEAYVALTDRTAVFPSYYAQFGQHAISELGDPSLAERMFKLAVDASAPDPAYPTQIVRVLAADGHPALAATIASYAESKGMQIRVDGPGR